MSAISLNNFINENKLTINNIIIIYTIIDCIATLTIGSIALFAPNLHVTIFQKEPTMVLLVIMIMLMIILSLRSLRYKMHFAIIRFVIGTFITIFIIYSTWLFINWYKEAIESTFSFRFLSFTKQASLEDKLHLYNTMTTQFIDAIRETNSKLADYLEQSPSVINPSNSVLIKTSYNSIPQLAQKVIHSEQEAYRVMIENIIKTTPSPVGHNSNLKAFLRWSLITLGTTIATYFVYQYGISYIKDMFLKILTNLGKTQSEVKRLSTEAIDQSTRAIEMNNDLIQLSSVVTLLWNKVTGMETIICPLLMDMDRNIHLINTVIRPSIQATFLGLNHIDDHVAGIILKGLTQEQRDFIRATSQIIFPS